MRTDLTKPNTLPLEVPFILFVEPTNACNFACNFCPESLPDFPKQAGYHTVMSEEVWAKTLESIRGFKQKIKVIYFHHLGEPFSNTHLTDMIKDVEGLCEETRVNTNGTHLSVRIIDSGLKTLNISVYGTDNIEYKKATGVNFSVSSIITRVKTLRHYREAEGKVFPKIRANFVSNDQSQAKVFLSQWAGVADECEVKPMHNWADTYVQLGGRPAARKAVCPLPFYEMVVKANGIVTVCRVDWNNHLAVGDIREQTLDEIWHGERFVAFREAQLRGERFGIPSCAECNLPEICCPDNLDVLLKK